MKKIIMVIVFFAFSTNAHALNCSDPKNGREISICLGQEQTVVDTELNHVYQKLIKENTNHKKELINSEIAWIKFRDLECKFQSLSFQGGTEESREYTRTFIKLTKERIQHLKTALSKRG